MKNKYYNYGEYLVYTGDSGHDSEYKVYDKYVDIDYYIEEYLNFYPTEEREESKLARKKAEERNNKIDQILSK
jgi:hypothetical protein